MKATIYKSRRENKGKQATIYESQRENKEKQATSTFLLLTMPFSSSTVT